MASRQYLSGAQKRKLKFKKDEQLKKLKGSLDNFIKPQLPDSETSRENLNTKSVKEVMYGCSCNIVGSTDNNNSNCECESIESVAQVVDTEVVNVTDVEQIANARVNELNLKNEYPTDRVHFNENINDSNIKRSILAYGPCRPNIAFPSSAHEDGNTYKFSSYFYSMTLKSGIKVQRFWLCYSVGLNVAYCETCWLFANRQYSYYNTAWINGVDDWRHLTFKIDKHEKSIQHIDAGKIRYNWEKNFTIDKVTEKQYSDEATYWREVLTRIIKVILSLTAGNTALRGHEHKNNDGLTTSEAGKGPNLEIFTWAPYYQVAPLNESIMWVVYNDSPTNGTVTFTMGHSKGMVVANNSSGLWLVHSVPKFPHLPYQNNNSYTYPKTGVKYGQSFLCMSMTAEELDKVGNQLINNEVLVYGSHFGGDLKSTYPGLYNATLPHHIPGVKNDGVRLQNLHSSGGFEFLSISKNRHFGKDLYEDLITHMADSNVYTETWLNSADRFNSSCSNKYKTMNIKSLAMKDIKGLKNVWYESAKDHSKWVVTGKSSVHWTCIGDINRSEGQTKRGGGTVCIKSLPIWNQYKQLVSNIEKCKI